MHGYGASKECFLRQIDYFSYLYTVTAFDFPGFGQSYPLSYAYSVGDYAAVTHEFLSSMGIIRPLVIAHSFGGRVAVKMAGAADCFGALVLTGGAGIVKRGPVYSAKVLSYKVARRLFPDWAAKNFGSDEYRSLSPVMRQSFKKIVNEDLRLTAKNIRCKTLLLYGERDKTTPVKYGRIYSAAIPHSALKIMRGCGHFAFLDDALAFNMLAEEFFLSAEEK